VVAAAPERRSSSLPIPRTRLIGREAEVAGAHVFLLDDAVPLLTLTGPGGVGKTRLAFTVAREMAEYFADGVTWVDLAPVSDAALVPAALATALGLGLPPDHRLLEELIRHLRPQQRLLLLDNCEHVLRGVAELAAALLATCPAVQVLATSRAPLRIRGEQQLPVNPLSLPPDTPISWEVVMANPAVRLFHERARAVRPEFRVDEANAASVAALCRYLEGLPLAIELAAVHSKSLEPGALMAQMTHRLTLLGAGGHDLPPRQRALRATMAWSYDLLSPDDQRLFRRLAVFVGGWSIPAAAAVSGGWAPVMSALTRLVDQHVILPIDGFPAPRFTMLETMREYGLEQLEATGELQAARDMHATYYVELGAWLDPNRLQPGERFDDRLRQIDAEHSNLRAALTHLARRGNASSVLELAGWLAVFWCHRDHLREGRQWLDWGLAHTSETPTVARGRALVGLGLMLWTQGDADASVTASEAGLAIAEACDDSVMVSLAMHDLGLVETGRRRWADAARWFEQALERWRAHGMSTAEGAVLHQLGGIARELGDGKRAANHAEAALALFRSVGHHAHAALALRNLALLARDRSDDVGALRNIQESLRLWTSLDQPWASTRALAFLGALAADYDQAEAAATLVGAIDAVLAANDSRLMLADADNYDHAKTRACSALDAAQFDALYAAGKALPFDEVIALAGAVTVRSRQGPSLGSQRDQLRPMPDTLTSRERDVLRLLASGRTDQEIADVLFLSRRTVNTHVARILGKLGARNRREAVAVGRTRGLLAREGDPAPYT
jgi:non-specific serine/threonine protein kinase